MMAGNLTCSQLVSSYIQVGLAMSVYCGKQDEQVTQSIVQMPLSQN